MAPLFCGRRQAAGGEGEGGGLAARLGGLAGDHRALAGGVVEAGEEGVDQGLVARVDEGGPGAAHEGLFIAAGESPHHADREGDAVIGLDLQEEIGAGEGEPEQAVRSEGQVCGSSVWSPHFGLPPLKRALKFEPQWRQ